jgi:hypothetical protein
MEKGDSWVEFEDMGLCGKTLMMALKGHSQL